MTPTPPTLSEYLLVCSAGNTGFAVSTIYSVALTPDTAQSFRGLSQEGEQAQPPRAVYSRTCEAQHPQPTSLSRSGEWDPLWVPPDSLGLARHCPQPGPAKDMALTRCSTHAALTRSRARLS